MELPAGALVVLYDGVCAFCNGVVRFLMKRDRDRRMWFASLQSAFAAEVLARHGRTAATSDTMYLVTAIGTAEEHLASKSDAALALAGALGPPWRWGRVLRIVPRAVRDAVYDLIARVRYRIFGKHETCPIPPAEWRERFIEV